MKKIYVSCSLTHASEEFKQSIDQLKDRLRPRYEILDFFGLADGDPKDIYEHDLQCVHGCDLMLSEVSFPAIGLGFEIGTAIQINKPVLAVAKTDAKVSRLVLGIQSPQFNFHRYDSMDEVIKLIDQKIS